MVMKVEKPDISRRVGIMTLGCKVNQYESEAIAEEFEKNGFIIGRFSEKCGIYIINTCTVTGEADRKARQMIRRAARHNPRAYILVTGCYAQLNPGKTAGIDGVDFVCGNSNKLRLVDAALGLIASGEKNRTADIKVDPIKSAPLEKMCINNFERSRAYVKIEDGCDNRCTYCTVPLARGSVRSKEPEDVLNEVRGLANRGFYEVVLTGIETASYGKDFDNGYRLIHLLEEVNDLGVVERIRMGSLDPTVLKPEFVDKISTLEHCCPHFHISVQSGSSTVLAAMKRKYNADTVLKNMEYVREKIPGATFSADMIVGFPGETDELFEETVEFVKKAKFLHLHVFPYSKRSGTIAAEMENQIPDNVKSERVAKLEQVGREIVFEMAEQYIGTQKKVLFETCEDGRAIGHTEEFLEVSVITDANLHGEMKLVKLNGFSQNGFSGFII